MVQKVLAIAIVLGTALALSGVFASATHENDRPNIAGIDAPDIRLLEARHAAEAAREITAASGTFGIKPGKDAVAAAQGEDARPRPEMPANVHFKPKTVTLGATGRKAARRVQPAATVKADSKAASKAETKSPTRIASAKPAPAAATTATANAGKSADAGAAVSVAASSASGSGGSIGATRSGSNDGAAASAAPTILRTPADTCMGSSSAAGQGVDVGVSMATTWRDANCILLKNARALLAQGNRRAAKIRLCMDDKNALAFEVVGEPCPRSLKSSRLAAATLKEWNKGRPRSIAAAPTRARSAETRNAVTPGSVQDFLANAGNRVLFGFDQFKVTPDAAKTLDKQAAWLKRHAKVTAIVEGHADARGTEKYNLALGERRAAAIRDYLIGKGIAPSRVKTISYGEARPAVQGETEAAWSQNRRGVTFVLNTSGKSKVTTLSAAPGTAQSTLAKTGGSAAGDRSLGLKAPPSEDEIE
jgi:peptidoglycan-associated lipoprotein